MQNIQWLDKTNQLRRKERRGKKVAVRGRTAQAGLLSRSGKGSFGYRMKRGGKE